MGIARKRGRAETITAQATTQTANKTCDDQLFPIKIDELNDKRIINRIERDVQQNLLNNLPMNLKQFSKESVRIAKFLQAKICLEGSLKKLRF